MSLSNSLNNYENPITLKELDCILSKTIGGLGPDGLPFELNITFFKALRYLIFTVFEECLSSGELM